MTTHPTQALDPQAVATLTDPAGLPLLTIQAAWDALKSARGQNCNWDRLRVSSHLQGDNIRPLGAVRPNTVAAMIAEVSARTRLRIQTHAAAQGYPTRPDDGGAAA